jgi:hypothetical protein
MAQGKNTVAARKKYRCGEEKIPLRHGACVEGHGRNVISRYSHGLLLTVWDSNTCFVQV